MKNTNGWQPPKNPLKGKMPRKAPGVSLGKLNDIKPMSGKVSMKPARKSR